MSEDERLVVLYDQDCGFCKWSLNKILAWDRRRRLRPVAIQSEEGQRLLDGVPESRRLESWHAVRPGGQVLSGGYAAPAITERLPCGSPLTFVFRRFPRTTDRCYSWVASNRDRVAGWLRIDASCEVRR